LTDAGTANYDEYNDDSDVDDETYRHMQKEMRKAEENHEEPYGKQGSFLNKLILHGNKKTEDELASGSTVQKENQQIPTRTAGAQTGSTTNNKTL